MVVSSAKRDIGNSRLHSLVHVRHRNCVVCAKGNVKALLLYSPQQFTTFAFGKHKHTLRQRQRAFQRTQGIGPRSSAAGRENSSRGGLLHEQHGPHLCILVRLDLLVSYSSSHRHTVHIYIYVTNGRYWHNATDASSLACLLLDGSISQFGRTGQQVTRRGNSRIDATNSSAIAGRY